MKKFIIGAIIIVAFLWGYGYVKGKTMHDNGELSLFSAGLTYIAMNPITAHGFKTYLSANTDISDRANKFKKSTNNLD
jgi:hypothetical protein